MSEMMGLSPGTLIHHATYGNGVVIREVETPTEELIKDFEVYAYFDGNTRAWIARSEVMLGQIGGL